MEGNIFSYYNHVHVKICAIHLCSICNTTTHPQVDMQLQYVVHSAASHSRLPSAGHRKVVYNNLSTQNYQLVIKTNFVRTRLFYTSDDYQSLCIMITTLNSDSTKPEEISPASMSLGDRELALFSHSSTLTAKITHQ